MHLQTVYNVCQLHCLETQCLHLLHIYLFSPYNGRNTSSQQRLIVYTFTNSSNVTNLTRNLGPGLSMVFWPVILRSIICSVNYGMHYNTNLKFLMLFNRTVHDVLNTGFYFKIVLLFMWQCQTQNAHLTIIVSTIIDKTGPWCGIDPYPATGNICNMPYVNNVSQDKSVHLHCLILELHCYFT